MKTLEYLILTVLFSFAIFQSSTAAETKPNLYVIIQHADGSASYDANFERIHEEILNKYSENSNIIFVSYNVSSDEITANTKNDFDWYSVYIASYDNQGQEGIIIMDSITKQVIARYNLDAGTKDILKSIAEGSQIMARANQ